MPGPVHYREHPPDPVLADRVECVWTSTISAGFVTAHHRVLPDGCMDLLFDFQATSAPARVSVVGTMSRPHIFLTIGAVDLLGIRFRPGGLSSVVPLNAAELTDREADLASLLGRWPDEIWHELSEADPAIRIGRVQEAIMRRHPAPMDRYVRYSVSRIHASRGAVRLAALEAGTGLSARQLERKFAQHLGVSPKTFARIVRFKCVTSVAKRSEAPADWARLAAESGFADQPHLAREIKAFSGLCPTDFRAWSDGSARDVGFLQDQLVAEGE